MKNNCPTEPTYKEVVVIGNGPSGIALSYMLSGYQPFVTSAAHPDEMFSMRLKTEINKNLIQSDLEYLATGLEGRTTNPVSLVLDSLIHPFADVGLEMEPLVEWSKNGVEIDHVVLGKGPPGGSWHTMDPHILTLSLGSWMALPGLPFHSRDSGEKRAFACNVAQYYEQYVNIMDLSRFFHNGIVVTNVQHLNPNAQQHNSFDKRDACGNDHRWVAKIENDLCDRVEFCSEPEIEENSETDNKATVKQKICSLTDAMSLIFSKGNRKLKTNRCCKRPRENRINHDLSPDRKIREIADDSDQIKEMEINTLSCLPTVGFKSKSDKDRRCTNYSCNYSSIKNSQDNLYSNNRDEQGSFNTYSLRNSYSLDFSTQVPFDFKISEKVTNQSLCNLKTNCDLSSTSCECSKIQDAHCNWSVEAFDINTGKYITYTCKYLVLANGASDIPNRLAVSNGKKDPNWLCYDVRCLEEQLELTKCCYDPILVIGAGLSAADAIIISRGRNIPVIHVFRNKSPELNRHLPENMYPEYHKVHQMMKDGGSTYPLYTALPEYTLTDINESTHTVTLTSKSGEQLKYKVSFAAILIGSRPDLSFLPKEFNLGINKNAPIDCKTNTIDINKLTHAVNGYNNLYAIGPLAGDNFVRFIPGGALAVISDLYKQKGY